MPWQPVPDCSCCEFGSLCCHVSWYCDHDVVQVQSHQNRPPSSVCRQVREEGLRTGFDAESKKGRRQSVALVDPRIRLNPMRRARTAEQIARGPVPTAVAQSPEVGQRRHVPRSLFDTCGSPNGVVGICNVELQEHMVRVKGREGGDGFVGDLDTAWQAYGALEGAQGGSDVVPELRRDSSG